MGMIDLGIIAIVLISALFAMYRGLVRELLGLIAWVLAAFGAFYGLLIVRPLFRKMITNATVADITAAIVIALVILVVCTIVNAKINDKLRKSVLSGLDRILGLIFGALRGLLLVVIIYFFAAFAMPAETIEEYKDKNFSVAYLQKTVPVLESVLPESFMIGVRDMSDETLTTENVEIKQKPEQTESISDKETPAKEAVPYDNHDLESMDVLLESIEQE